MDFSEIGFYPIFYLTLSGYRLILLYISYEAIFGSYLSITHDK